MFEVLDLAKMKTKNVVLILFSITSVSSHMGGGHQMMSLNITKQTLSLTNSSVGKHDDVTICGRFFVKPSSVEMEIWKHGPLALKSTFDPSQAVDQMNGYVGYELSTQS